MATPEGLGAKADELALELRGVAVWRRVQGGRRDLLRDMDWRVRRGERWGIVGPNGAGKSTLLRVASAQMRPSSGEATILGGRLGRVSMPELRRRIGFVEGAFGRRFYPDQTVREVVLTGLGGTILVTEEVGPAQAAAAAEALRAVGAGRLAPQPFSTLSEGERARVLVARALMTNAELLVLDEPAAGLDLGGRELLLAAIVEVSRARPQLTMLMVSHHLEELPEATTHLLLLRDGAVVAAGPVDDVARPEHLSACFGLALDVERRAGRVFVTATSPRAAEPLLRVATPDDRGRIDALMKESARALFPRFYDERQAASAVRHVAEVDTMLLEDGTYFVLERSGELVGCGGWSRRDRLYTGSGASDGDGRHLDPATEPARVRAMFVRDDWTRRGLGRRILDACEEAAAHEGFTRLALVATLPGLPLYLAYGFGRREDLEVELPDGVAIPCVAMEKAISG